MDYQRWEGIYTAGFTLDAVRSRCSTLAGVLAERGWSCMIGYDTRFMSVSYAVDCFRLLERRGVRVSFHMAPLSLPVVEMAFDQRRTDCALVISAGNRPFWYNGMIVVTQPANRALLEPAGELYVDPPPFPTTEPAIEEAGQIDARTPYIQALRSMLDLDLIRRAALTMFVDVMNGTASGLVPGVIGDGAQTKAIEINREPDTLFGRQTPQPTESNLGRLRKLVRESDSHFGSAVSADGRAVCVVDNFGELVPLPDLALLLGRYLSQQHRQRGVIILPGNLLPAAAAQTWEQHFGLKLELAANPATRIGEILKRDRHSLIFGATAESEIVLGRYSASFDGTLVALALAEAAARTGRKLRALLDDLRGHA
jgi:phosphomannomutase